MTIFYHNSLKEGENELSEEESKHCSQVLRHKEGDPIQVFDGNGGCHSSVLTQVSKKKCVFKIIESKYTPQKNFKIHLGIAPTKNADRMEWMIEKLSEIGVDEVTFIQTQHSERKKLRIDRLSKKAISAMKQSKNPFLLRINELEAFQNFVEKSNSDIKFIAHVDKDYEHLTEVIIPKKSISILIGPEGDFSVDEVLKAKNSGFKTVSLGQNTLRTETAGFTACCMVNFVNKY